MTSFKIGSEKGRTMSGGTRRIKVPDWIWWSIVFLIITSLVVAIFIWIGHVPHEDNRMPDEAGQFGDSYGFANSMFSALAFAGVIVTLMMQITELKHQREELSASRRSHEEIASLNLVGSYLSSIEMTVRLNDILEKQKSLNDQMSTRRLIVRVEKISDFLDPLVDDLLVHQFQALATIRNSISAIDILIKSSKRKFISEVEIYVVNVGIDSMKSIAEKCMSTVAMNHQYHFLFSATADLIQRMLQIRLPESNKIEFVLSEEELETCDNLMRRLRKDDKFICELFVMSERAKKQ